MPRWLLWFGLTAWVGSTLLLSRLPSFRVPPLVERHRANILARLGMRDRTQLTRYAIRAGLVEP